MIVKLLPSGGFLFLFLHQLYKSVTKGDFKMNVTRTSILSGTTQTIFIDGLTQAMLDRHADGELIQDALAGIPVELREFVMTGISPAEWAEKLPEDDDAPHAGECMLGWEELLRGLTSG